MRKIFKSSLIAFLLITVFAAAGFAWNATGEVRRLYKEVPSFDTFGNPQAIIWLKDYELKYNPNDTVDASRYTIIYFGERIPESWREHKIAVPAEGALQVAEAAVYNPMTGMKESSLKVDTETLPGGMNVHTVHISDQARGRAVVLIENERRINQKNINTTITMADQFPVWEQKIAVQMPHDKTLFWFANKMREPELINNKNEKIYFWAVTNQPAWHGKGIRVFQRPFISFGTSQKLLDVLETMQTKAELYTQVEKPSGAPSDGSKLIRWMEAPERNEARLPGKVIRPLNMLPKNGPWTSAERTLLLSGWLNKGGRNTKIWWQAPAAVMADSAVAEDFWSSPVIVSSAGKKAVYYQAGQGVDYGDVSPFLSGTDIYRRSDKKPAADAEKSKKKKKVNSDGFDTKEVKAGSPADHRLYMLWNLKLTPDGVADGTLSATIDGAWAGIFSGGAIPTKENAPYLLFRNINFAIPGMTLTPTEVKMLPTGYKLDFKVHCVPGIVQNRNMLLKLPGGIPEILGQLLYDNDSVTFRFPFIIDQKVRIATPKGYKCYQNDIKNVIGARKTSQVTEILHTNAVRNQFEADCTWTLKKLKLEMDEAEELKKQIGAFLAWPNLNLPFRK